MNPEPEGPAGGGGPQEPPSPLPGALGYAPFSWKLSSNINRNLPPPVPPKIPLKNPRRFALESQTPSYQSSSSAPSTLNRPFLFKLPIETSTPFPGGAYSPANFNIADYSLPNSYDRDFRVQRDLGQGSFGTTAILEVVSAEDGGIAHGFRLQPGTVFVAKKIETDPRKARSLYLEEWRILNTLRGHRNMLHAMCTQQPRDDHPYGHIFMEYCDMGDVWSLVRRYEDNFMGRMRQYGFSRFRIPKELLYLEALPEGFAYEMMTSVARGLAWMQYGIRDWPVDSAINPNWTSIMHNDLKTDNIFMVSRPAGDKCPYPIFKIGDLGAATRSGAIAFIGNISHAAPERVTRCLSIPSVPADDVYGIGSMMYEVAYRTNPHRYDNTRSMHMVFGQDANGSTVPCPNGCPNPDRKHMRGRPYSLDSQHMWVGCARFHGLDYSVRSPLKYPAPHAKWWHELVEQCLELERQDRPHIIEVLEQLYLGRRGRREDNIGSPLVLWQPHWLPQDIIEGIEDREQGLDDIWAKASANRRSMFVLPSRKEPPPYPVT
ncbi:G2-specific serine/threonine protein kinase [Arthrobotrys megalospora]